jgi:hypothetical protein
MPKIGAKKRRRHKLISVTSVVVKGLPIQRSDLAWIRVQPAGLDTSYSVVVFA